jgi:hypothetical protein
MQYLSLESFLYELQFDMHFYMHSYLHKLFIPVKSGCYSPRAQNLTAVEEKWRGDGGEPHRRQERVAESRTQPGDGEEQSMEETLRGGGAADSKARD